MRKLKTVELGRKSVEEFRQSEKLPVTVVLDNVRSMHNVGSVFRTADAFLLGGVCLCGYTPRPPHRDIQKTALGATESVDWSYYETTEEAVKALRAQGYRVWAVEQTTNSTALQDFEPKGPTAVVFGNEVDGVTSSVLPLCDGVLEIPQWGTKHSLNVSVAAGIVLWEIRRSFIV
ncbi:RNA methyltransferase [Dinghuibacter silviterrae]|uniref:SpoU rRNA methylase family protein n=1 Tax=Dinghuibacter silviterrae TaxID=1539049 RepID=A0A4V3GKP6_9BACT|nr:RNA methyltransferase [Dinghuibacter silviterrae]TDW96502.1 SpoU rRNA methylase family protein [Dinghuibacter silviterrae]